MSVAIKICGIKTPEVMAATLDAGADYVGLVFFPRSPRHLELSLAKELANMASGRAEVVALLVNPSNARVAQIATELGPDILQLHGSETPDRVAEIAELSGTRTMKAVAVATRADAERALAFRGSADMILFDAKPPKGAVLPGGNGLAFDWTMLDPVASELDYMLSGGLTPETVANAIAITGASAVDVSSGVESAPGVKSIALIKAFIEKVRAATSD